MSPKKRQPLSKALPKTLSLWAGTGVMGVRPVALRRRSAVATCAATRQTREGHVRGFTAGVPRAYHLAVLGKVALVHGLVRGQQVSGRVEVGKEGILPNRTRT